MNSANFSGRLSSALGRRKPYSTSTVLRDVSPSYMPPICGMVAWLSSTMSRKSSGKKSSSVHGVLPGGAAAEMAGVVLDALAEAHLLHHLEVILRAHLDALGLEQLALLLELRDALLQFRADGDDGPAQLVHRA